MKAIERSCQQCGVAYFGHKSKIYCSAECRKIGKPPVWNKNKTGIPANRPKNGTEKPCAMCGKAFYVSRAMNRIQCCSPECYRNKRYGAGRQTARACVICGETFPVCPSSKNVTCGKVCRRVHKSRLHQADKSHFWRGGKMAPYNGVWKEQRAAARERDGYKCALCDSTDRIQVHHKFPYRYSKSHNLDNLITLCRSCHSKEEYKVNATTRDVLALGRAQRFMDVDSVDPIAS